MHTATTSAHSRPDCQTVLRVHGAYILNPLDSHVHRENVCGVNSEAKVTKCRPEMNRMFSRRQKQHKVVSIRAGLGELASDDGRGTTLETGTVKSKSGD